MNPSLDVSQYAHKAWLNRDGFANAAITSMAQTPDGYLWLGTELGLLRFDGVRTVPWQSTSSQELPSSSVTRLLAARRDGTLWIGTTKGLASWKGSSVTLYPEFAGQEVVGLLEDRDGAVWVSVYGFPAGKLCIVQQGRVQCNESANLGVGVFGLYEDRNGTLWAGATNGVWRWKPRPPRRYLLPDEPTTINGFSGDESGVLLIGTSKGLLRLMHEEIEPYLVTGMKVQVPVRSMHRDREGSLWIGTQHGLVHSHDGRTDVFAEVNGLSGDTVFFVFEDREGSVWVSTDGGVDRFREFAVSTYSAGQGLSSSTVWSVFAGTDGSVWFGTDKGLNRWNNGHVTPYDGRPVGSITSSRKPVLRGFPDDIVESLFQDVRGRLWISAPRAVGYLEHERFIALGGVPGGMVEAIAEDTDTDLWIANQDRGLFRARRDGTVRQIPWSRLGRTDYASVLAGDPSQGGVWIGFVQSGVTYVNDGQVRASYAARDGLGDGIVSDFHFDHDGAVWASTEGGLSRVKDGRVATLSIKNGLPCNAVYGVLEDDEHSFWLHMTCGLVRIARSELDAWIAAASDGRAPNFAIQTTVFDSSDGVWSRSGASFFNPRVARSPDGKLWFLSANGVSVVDPRHIPFNHLPPPVHIEQITADRKSYGAVAKTNGPVLLPPLVRDLQIDYTALSLVAPEKNQFRIKLEGWDRDWHHVGTRRQAFYNNLPPRTYRFRVMASNNSGVWNEAAATVDLSIAPAYYQTTWFRAAIALAALTLLWAAYRYRLRQVAYEFDARLQERVNERTRIARELHDTLLQSFHGLLFRFQAATNTLPDQSATRKMLESAIDQAAKAITEGRDAVQNLRASAVVTNDLAEAITTLAGELAANQAGDSGTNAPTVDVSVAGTPRNLHPILRDDIYRIAGEALRNAFRHAGARRIEVEIRYDEGQLQVRVRDDGKGIGPTLLDEDRPGHFGIRGMRERAELVGGHLDVWSKAGLGTEVELTIPAAAAYATPRARRVSRLFARTGVVLAWIVLASSRPAIALNPALDVSQYVHTAWKIREGFTKGSITSIAQTPDGYLWIGTEFGLLRFDGVRNVPWEPPPNQHLPSSYITNLLVARDGTLWIGTLTGLASWKAGTLTNYSEYTATVSGLLEDRDGAIWAGGQGPDHARFCSIRNTRTQCEETEARLGLGVSGLYEGRDGRLWVGTSIGFWRWKPGPPQLISLPGEPNGIRGFAESADGTLLIPTRGSLRRWTTDGKELLRIALPARAQAFQSNHVLVDRDGAMWMSTVGGGVVHVHQGRMDVFSSPEGLSGDSPSVFLEDREGSVWVATSEGLDRFRAPIVSTLSMQQGLSNNGVTSVLSTTDGAVWLGSFEGLNRWFDGRNTIYRESHAPAATDQPRADKVREINGPGLPQHGVHALEEDHRGRLWVSTRGGVGVLDRDRWTSVPGIPGGNFNVIVEDSTETIWVAHYPDGLFQVLPGNVVRRVPPAELGHDDMVSTIVADRVRGGVWLGFNRGGVAYLSGGSIREWYTAARGLGKGRVNTLQLDRDGTIWAATDGGLSIVRGGRVTTLTSASGLPCDAIHWVIEDDADMFWLMTACGLARIPRSSLESAEPIHATIYDSSDGIRIHATPGSYTPHVSMARDGRIWFSTTGGAGVIDPRHLPFNALPPPVHIERVTANRAIYDPGSVAQGPMRLPPMIRDLEIDYTALSLVAPEKVLFRYKLDGFDPDWQDVGTRRQAFYNNLPPRNYRFRVIASNNSGVWNEAGAFLDLSIAPAYYQTAWFRVASVLGVLALLWAAYQYRLRQVAHEFDARLQERVNERTRIARELHDTLLQSFHGLLFRFQAATNMLPDRPVEAQQQFESAIEQAAQAITEGRDAVQNLRASTVITNDLGVAISALGEELAATHNQDAKAPTAVDVAVEGTPRDLQPILRDDIYRIAAEALRNAFRHAGARRIEVEIRYDEGQLQVRVRDDGKGIGLTLLDEDRPGHFGIRGMRERAELVGGHLDVWSKAGLGTEVELTIPAAAAYATPRVRNPSGWFAGRTGTNA